MKKNPRNDLAVEPAADIQTFLRYLLGDPDQFWDWTYIQSQKFDFYYGASNLLAIKPIPKGKDMKTGIVNIYWDIDLQAYRIASDYNVDFKDRLKSTCGKGNYAFDAVTKTWSFTEGFLDDILKLVEQYYPGDKVNIEHKDVVETAAKAAKAVIPVLAPELKNAITFVAHLDAKSLEMAYKSRVKTLHPDAGGNGTEFAEFNSAYQALRKEMK